MKGMISGIFVAVLLVPSVALGGLACDEHFIVFAANQQLADDVLDKAAQMRRTFALEWLGEELPPSPGRVVLHVEISDRLDTGRTWVDAAAEKDYHMVWLNTTREKALGSTLAHEVVHLVFAAHFKGSLPAWADEGVASLQDDEMRHALRRELLQSFSSRNAWPQLTNVLEQSTISPSDRLAYTVAASLTEYLLSQGDKATFLRFAAEGKASGWDQAAREHYGLSSIEQLQADWQAWAAGMSAASRGARTAVLGAAKNRRRR